MSETRAAAVVFFLSGAIAIAVDHHVPFLLGLFIAGGLALRNDERKRGLR